MFSLLQKNKGTPLRALFLTIKVVVTKTGLFGPAFVLLIFT